ncbi:TPA: hypothetical protein HA278_01445 [Candidatus Woesearchaeota archaeon]|nr:hypothetical protein [Candidatus Woesearchaeota archaeon]
MDKKETTFSDRAKVGMIKWSLKHGETGSEDELLEYARANMKGVDHSSKVKKGIHSKYDSQGLISEEYNRRMKLKIARYYDIPFGNVSQEKINMYYNDINFGNKNVLEWKRAHLDNTFTEASAEEVEKGYSEYLSVRFQSSMLEYQNGYLRTKREWYHFNNIDQKLFCRSSWEIEFCKMCDGFLLDGTIQGISVPQRIKYFRSDIQQWRHYYPDFRVETNDSHFVVEIKPFFKCSDQTNKDKFQFANRKHGKKFVIVTENELKLEKLKKLFNGEEQWNS